MTSLSPDVTNLGAQRSDRLYLLDALRGLAALSVVLWHWQHFFLSGPVSETVDRMKLPLYDWFFLFYEHGWLAIDLFFCLSGFVFYWQYSRSVAEGSITPGTFAILRLSRLYPLHVATLVLVAVGQYLLMQAQGTFFVYAHNDLPHFLLNLLFASAWGLEQGYSFNGPVWSISIEVLLYAMFFVCCRLFPVRLILLAAISLLGFLVQAIYHVPIGRGVGSFFLGGCVYLVYRHSIASWPRQVANGTVSAACLLVGAWLLVVVAAAGWFDVNKALMQVPNGLLGAIRMLLSNLPTLVLFPLTILSLAFIEYRVGPIGQSLSFLGDISYSSYLLHFPLQLCAVILATQFNVGHSLYYSGWAMAGFIVILLTLSLASHRYVEIPMQRFLRTWLVHRS